jgi:hypothetical protein
MNFKSSVFIQLLALGITAAASAQQSLRAPAHLISEGGPTVLRVWLASATKSTISYRETELSTAVREARISQFRSIYIYEPADYATAMNLYHARSYQKAAELFAKVKEQYQPLATIQNNPSTLAAFHEMECLRKLGDLDGLAAALARFDKSSLTRESHLRQIEIYEVWQAVNSKNWQQVESLVNDSASARLPGNQRAQLAYCHGLALEATDREREAIAAYQMAMTADAAASEDISRSAALRVLTILSSKPEVKRAAQIWGAPEENTSSPGYTQLLDAAAIARLYQMSLGGGEPLPIALRDLPGFQPKTADPTGDGATPPPAE